MKIFNIENGVEKVYIQLNDIIMLDLMNAPKTDLINIKTIKSSIKKNFRNTEFIEFELPEEIEYFRNLEAIIDYKELVHLTDDEFDDRKKSFNINLHHFLELSKIKKFKDKEDITILKLLKYQLKDIRQIEKIRNGNKKIALPLVPDSNGFSYVGEKDSLYEIRASLYPNKILFFRVDGESFSPEDTLSDDFKEGLDFIAKTMQFKDRTFSEVSTTTLSLDSKYLIIEFKFKKEKKGIQKIINKTNR